MNEDHISHQTDRASTIEVGQDHQRIVHTEKGIGMMSPIGNTGMTTMQTGQIVAITIS